MGDDNIFDHPPPPMGEYDVEANDVLNFKLVWNQSDASKPSFRPQYTHQLFGEHQRIHGYKDLKVDMMFGAVRYINTQYSTKKEEKKRTKKDEEPEVTPVAQILCEKLPPTHQPTTNLDTFMKHIEENETKFKPVGDRIHSYQVTPKPSSSSSSSSSASSSSSSDITTTYEIYTGEIENPEIAAYHEKLQFFVLFYIDCASYIEPDPDWRVFFVFEKRETSAGNVQYGIVGYCTAHLFYYYPESKRLRISQFVILPPYQRQGHGFQLLKSIYEYAIPKNIADVTVEDPSDDFAMLKDKMDMELIIKKGTLKGKPLKDKSAYSEIQMELKINKQQIKRCHEMFVLMTMDKTNEEVKKQFRLSIKSRLSKVSYKYLNELGKAKPEERKKALQELYAELETQYWQVISQLQVSV